MKDLQETSDTKDIRQTSLALYEYVLPVYRTEYRALAKMYDGGASKVETYFAAQAISDKYFPRFGELYNILISNGKLYAEKNNIKVNWDIGRM